MTNAMCRNSTVRRTLLLMFLLLMVLVCAMFLESKCVVCGEGIARVSQSKSESAKRRASEWLPTIVSEKLQ